jgi:hypothetical protein
MPHLLTHRLQRSTSPNRLCSELIIIEWAYVNDKVVLTTRAALVRLAAMVPWTAEPRIVGIYKLQYYAYVLA